MPLLRKKRNPGQPAWFDLEAPAEKTVPNGWRFSLKGSPRHYDDVKKIIEADPGARLYFSEALTYERGAGVAPIRFTFFLYLPNDPKHAELDLRQHTPEEVERFVRENAPRSEAEAQKA